MNIASVDIGSNTVLLLIVSADLKTKEMKPVANEYRMPRISKGLKENGEINSDAVDRLYDVLKDYKKIIDTHDCGKVIAKATNALRIASNSGSIIKSVKEKFDIDIDVIPGEKEAEFSYLGAAMSSDEDEKFVIDIGGGSTEIIYGKGNEVIFKKSHPVGAVMLTENFTEHDPPQKDEVRNIDKHLDDVFSRLTGKIPTGTPGIAVAGTPTSLSAMDKGLKEYDEEKIEASFLSYDSIKKLSETLLSLKSGDVLKNFGPVVKGREDVMFAGALILKKVSQILHTKGFTVSGKGIRYGAIVDYLKSID